MTRVVVSAETETWTTRPRDPDDSWDQGDSDGHVSNVVAFLEREESTYYGASHGKDLGDVEVGNTVYAVVADFTSGSTFGRDGGHADVLDFFRSPAEAEELAKAALKAERQTESWSGRKEDVFDYSFEHNGETYSRAWVGYFEHLNSLDIWACPIKRAAKDPWSDDPNPGYKVGR